VSRLATAKAAMSAAIPSQVPRFFDRFAALDSDPVTCDARSSAVVTVAFARTYWISALTPALFEALVALP
jgi:hypothetical protein